MRMLKSGLLSVLLLGHRAAAQQPGMEGVVIDTITRQPLSGVHITMLPSPHDGTPAAEAYGAMSLRDGHFSISGMKPGIYMLNLQRNGYIHVPGKRGMPGEEERIALKSGEQLTGFLTEMTPRAIISGRVLDEYGDPVQHSQVEAIPLVPGSLLGGMGGRTDERGQFRISGAPGKYYVKATHSVGPYEPGDGRSGPPVYADTYYPSAVSKDRASVIEAAAARELKGIEVRLVRTASLTISGVVTGLPDRSTPALVWIIRRGPEPQGTQVSTGGKFKFSGLTPGRYRISASAMFGGNPLWSQPLDVNLENADATNLAMKLIPGEELSGTLEIQGDPSKTTPPEKLTVRLEAYSVSVGPGDSRTPKGGEADRTGAFHFAQVFPIKFRVSVRGMPENGYVKSVKLDDAVMQDNLLDLSQGARGANLKVMVSLNGGQVEGTVLGEDGKPFPGPLAFVFLAATADQAGDSSQSVESGARFRFTGLRPGTYRLFAADPRQAADAVQSARAMFPNAPKVEVKEGGGIVVDAKVLSEENPNAKP